MWGEVGWGPECIFLVLKKDKILPSTGHEVSEVHQMYRSTFSLTQAQDVGRWLRPRYSRFITGKQTRYPLYKRLGGPQDRCGWGRKILPSPGFDPRTNFLSMVLISSRCSKAAPDIAKVRVLCSFLCNCLHTALSSAIIRLTNSRELKVESEFNDSIFQVPTVEVTDSNSSP